MRRAMTAAVLVAGLVWLPAEAAANGGAYLELDHTYYVHGASGEAEYYVEIPRGHQDLLERGPFYGYLLPLRDRLVEGRPLPSSAVRVGTFTVEEGKGDVFEFTLVFDTPTLSTGDYQVRLCNDPCTVTGFDEPVTGYATIAATATEVQLMRRTTELRAEVFHAERQLERAQHELARSQEAAGAAESARQDLQSDVTQLRAEVADLQATPAPARPLVDAWAAVAIAFVLGFVGAAVVRRTRRRSAPATEPATA